MKINWSALTDKENRRVVLTFVGAAILCMICLVDRWTRQPIPTTFEQAFFLGKRAGALMVINYDRKSAGEETFGSWEAYEDYVAGSDRRIAQMESFFKEIQDIRVKKEEQQKKYPPSPWVDHKKTNE